MKEIILLITTISSLSGSINIANTIPDVPKVQKQKMVIDESLAGAERDEILWLARILYSETKISKEMELVAWVVKNRVESKYTGSTYEEVAKSKYQFSGLNDFDKQYKKNISMNYGDRNPAWKNALDIANEVYYADDSKRPFPSSVKHFYSPVSVYKKPNWALGKNPYYVTRLNSGYPVRFAFYNGVR
jgi:hypothetical protein